MKELKTEVGAKILRQWKRGLRSAESVKSALQDFTDADIINDIQIIISEYLPG